MRMLILKIGLFSVMFLTLTTAFYFLRPNLFVENFTNINRKLDIINLGSSHGNSFRYELLDINGNGFCKEGNTLYYDLQNYHYLKPNLSDSAVIVIPLSYFSFGVDENRTDNGEYNAFVNDYYQYLPKEKVYDYSFKRKIDVYANEARSNFFDFFNSIKIFKDKEIKWSLSGPEDLESHSIKRARQHKRAGEYISPERNIEYLTSLVEDAKNQGYKPVLVVTPFYARFNEIVGSEWLDNNFYRPIEKVRNKVDIPLLDYSHDTRIIFRKDLFYNSDHLNTPGKIYFSQLFFEDLKSLNFINE